jgi:hypothetical protein
MARIIARFEPPHIAALVERGRWSKPVVTSELNRILIERRRRILERYLTRLSPLTWPEVRTAEGASTVCMQDLAVWTGIRPAVTRTYGSRAWAGPRLEPVPVAAPVAGEDASVCVRLPELANARRGDPRYLVVDIQSSTPGRDTPGPARLHFWVSDAPRLAGLERPEDGEAPSP